MSSFPMSMTGMILEDLKTVCTGKDTYLSDLYWLQLDMVLENIHVTHYKIELDIEVQGQDGAFEVAIAANDDPIYNGCLDDGKHTLHK